MVSTIHNGVSIIVCCYNSSKRLPKTLEHLANQKFNNIIKWEIIVVNNNSSDDTEIVAKQEWAKYITSANFTLVEEKIPGLSAARHKGIQEASYEYIVFCDDDNWLCENYIEVAFDIMNNNSQIGALCGYNIPISNIELPLWFTTVQGTYAIGVISIEDGDVTTKGWIWGAGMVLRKSVLEHLFEAGFVNLTTDRKGKELSTGGDVEICKWLILAGFKLWYSESISLTHFIPEDRLNKLYYLKLNEQNCLNNNLMETYDFIIREVDGKIKFTSWVKFFIGITPKSILSRMSLQDILMLNLIRYKLGITSKNQVYFKIKEAFKNYKSKNKHSIVELNHFR